MNQYTGGIQASLQYARTGGSSYARLNCPACPDRAGKTDRKGSLSVNLVTGWYRCWRCGAEGRVDLPDSMRREGAIGDTYQETLQVMPPPDGFMLLGEEPALSAEASKLARDYLVRRGLVDPAIWRAVGIGCCLEGRHANRVVVPVLAPDGAWLGWVARSWFPSSRPYLNAPGMRLGAAGALFNGAVLDQQTDAPVLVVEGVFDALAYWPDAVAVLGKPTHQQVDTLRVAGRPVVIVLDGDAWEEGEQLAFRLRMKGCRAGWVRLPPRTDPDEVPREWMWNEAHAALEAV
jgi:hypothetical protein